MYRRIELIDHTKRGDFKHGLMGMSPEEVVDAWIFDLNSPRRALYKNCKFFFTEQGWANIGRRVIAACGRTRTAYRVIRIKEKSVDVFYQDEVQVAVRAKAKRKEAGKA